MYLDNEQENAIAQGKVLAFLLMGKNPCPLNVIFAAEKLQLEPEQISAALRALEIQGRIELVLTRAIVTLKDVPTGEPPLHIAGVLATHPIQSDTPPETIAPTKLDSEPVKKGAK
jgi:hypothetical protein